MMELEPASLPEIDEIEIVPLSGRAPPPVSRLHRKGVRVGSVSVMGTAAQEIAGLWRVLPPPGAVAACHEPPFALRFFHGDRFILEASLCWKCNNAYGSTSDESLSFLFEGTSPAARRLLATLDALCPGRTTE